MKTTAPEPAPRDTGVKAGQTDEPATYIRGGAGGIDVRKVVRGTVAICLIGLAVLVVLFTVAAVDRNARASRLRQNGVVVNVTVTQCIALLSGTGATEYAFSCKGTFTLDGRRFTEVIGGTTADFPPGATLRAETDRAHPGDLTTKYAELASHRAWRSFITPAILLLALVFLLAFVAWRVRRGGSRASRS